MLIIIKLRYREAVLKDNAYSIMLSYGVRALLLFFFFFYCNNSCTLFENGIRFASTIFIKAANNSKRYLVALADNVRHNVIFVTDWL